MLLDLLPGLVVLTSSAALEACTAGTSGGKKSLKLAELSFGCSGLFPVSDGHKLIQNFLQSLEPPFLVGGAIKLLRRILD
jgi:hypothetical protein